MASEQAPVEAPLALSKYSKRVILKTILDRPDGGVGLIGQRVVVGGWVRSSREFRKEPVAPAPDVGGPKDVSCVEVLQSRLPFFKSIIKVFGGEYRIREKLDTILPKPPQPSISILLISDGSGVSSLQVLIDSSLAPPSLVMPTGTCVLVEGILQKPSLQGKETIELKADKILHIGTVDQDRYPLSKKRLPLESLRDSAHFRPRTTTVASVMRIRSALTQATHTFFQENGFLYVQVPVITTTDCEGFGENFQVTTLLGKDQSSVDDNGGVKLETIKASIKEKSKQVEELKRSESNKEALAAAIQDLKKTTELVSQLEAKQKEKSGKSYTQSNRVDFSQDFFSCKTYLTVSGRLHLESYASALGKVYSFGPRFHAHRSDSKKLLAEMWMVELEIAFSELEDSMECATDFLRFICKWILENCTEDLKFISKRVDKLVPDRLQFIATGPFEKISYTQAVDVLKQANERKFQTKVEWGVSLNEEHESYLTDEIYKKPLIIYDHPKQLKPFYVRLNADGKTVAAFDVIVPKVGTLIRGSQNEERYNTLNARIKESGLEKQQYEWYLDLRRHGAVKCSGFSFLFDPLVLYATGLNDVRDAVPFPRSFGKANN
ncbi:UNVERIFIED_CONTAM: Asparagine--tRNA ligase, cytoplasmic 2 [Sesamum latifolium]|uniref:asparagine--tRNA ligase n=1 Tax=Sesamum latifolium TaxID=2727402 RepID=A0AAW2Y2T3_9LAMI